jgi:hypothetical protein
MEQEPTWILASKRFYGILITALSANSWVLSWLFGFDLDKETIGQLEASGAAIIENVGIVAGIVLTVIGSMSAKGGWKLFPK